MANYSTGGFTQVPVKKWTPPKPKKPKAVKPKVQRPKPVKPVKAKPVDPFAPTSDADLQKRAHDLVQTQLAPQIAEATRIANERAQQGTAAVQGYTNQFVGQLGDYADRAKAAYGQATSAQAANQDALRALLTGAGSNLSSELGGKLSQFGAPDAAQAQVAGGAALAGTGAANAGYAQGAATTEQLLKQGQNQGNYSAVLPGVAALQGLQTVKELQAQINTQLADKISSLSADGQQMYVQLYTHFLDDEWQKTLAKQSGQFKSVQAQADAAYRAQLTAYKKADLAYRKGKAGADRAEKAREANQRAATAKQNANTAKQRARESARHNKQSEKDQNQRQNKWQTNPNGSFKYRKNKKTGKMERIPIKPAKKGSTNSTTGIPHH